MAAYAKGVNENMSSRWILPGAVVALSTLGIFSSASWVSANSSTNAVALYASSPQERTGQPVTLMADTPIPLTTGQTLSIINTTTGAVVASTSTGTTLTTTVTQNAAATDQFMAEVTSHPLSVQWVDHAVGNNQGYQNALGQTVALNAPTGGASGVPITVTASPTGFKNAEYQFWWAMDGDTWHSSGAFSAKDSIAVTPPSDGILSVLVYARESTAPLHETSAERAQYEAKSTTATITIGPPAYQVSPGGVSGSGFVSLTTANEVQVGDQISLLAAASDISDPVYQFWYASPDNTWMSSGPYAPANTFTLSANMPGTWQVVVYARPGNAPANETLAQRQASEVQSPVSPITVHP